MQTKIKYKMTNREKRENRWGILFSLPCILGFLIFALLPMAVSLGLSFTNFNFTTGGQFIGISNYKNLFSGSDPYFYKSLLVTVIYVALSVPTAIIFSFFIAMLLNTNVKGKGFFRTIFYLPTVVPIVAMAAIWMWIFNPDMGLANNILKAMHLPVSTWLSGESSVIPTLVFINLWTTGSTMVTDIAPGYDHITSAIGGAIAAASGASFLCYVTPAEHLRLPNVDDVKEGIMASKIAAHAADIAKGVKGAMDWDNQMAAARQKLDWEKQFELALDPEKARRYRAESTPEREDTCTMCGKMCSVRNMNAVLAGEDVDVI